MKFRWIRNVQELGRVQIPSDYLDSLKIEAGDFVLIRMKDDDENTLLLTFNVGKKGKRKARDT